MSPRSRCEIVELIRAYARENFSQCMDGVRADPILKGQPLTRENQILSSKCADHSALHSAKYEAAKDILALMGEPVDDL